MQKNISILFAFLICLLIILSILLVISIKKGFKICNEPFENESRADFYMGNVKFPIQYNLKDSNIPRLYVIDNEILSQNTIEKKSDPSHINYFTEIKDYFKKLKKVSFNHESRLLFVPGDVHYSREDIPFIAKTRPINNKGLSVILPLNCKRHWEPIEIVKLHDIPYDKKKDIAIWRGVATGKDKRINLVENWYDTMDIGFTAFLNSYQGKKHSKYIKNKVEIPDMLKCKFLISVEGNDVATNLKWILSSQSVCIMPEPTMESWLMESKLVPWKHYVPVDKNFEELQDIIDVCKKNPELMKKIVANANEYMKQFSDKYNENSIIVEVLKRYTNLITIV